MSANLIEERRLSKSARSNPEQCRVSRSIVNRCNRAEPIRRYLIPPVTDDEEMKSVARAAIWMAFLGMTPLILFHIITFFCPDIFMIPVAP